MQTLFSAKKPPERRISRRAFLAGTAALGLIAAGSGAKYYVDHEDGRVLDCVLSYMSQPQFINPEFTEQLTGTKAELQYYSAKDGVVYFRIPREHFGPHTLSKLTGNPELAEVSPPGHNIRILGTRNIFEPENYVIRFPSRDFVVDHNKIVKVKYPKATYTLAVKELVDFLDNKSTYWGYRTVQTGERALSRSVIFANAGTYVAQRGEPSMKRLVSQLVGKQGSKEQVAQRLLDFVTEEIEYDDTDSLLEIETLKRPSEVLMTRLGDCNTKVVLYASLLEQTNIDYYVVYLFGRLSESGHATVAVNGSFDGANGLVFRINDRDYHVAETTVPGFRIGETMLEETEKFIAETYVQKPGDVKKILGVIPVRYRGAESNIIELRTGRKLKMGRY